jgi:hypothetical protein
MRNLNEHRNEDEITTGDIAGRTEPQREGEVISFSQQRAASRPQTDQTLLPADEVEQFRSRWAAIQANFVDEPRVSVEEADKLVASAIKRIADSFYEERVKLERQWKNGDDVSTEDLRQGLQHYRSFFSRLLSM